MPETQSYNEELLSARKLKAKAPTLSERAKSGDEVARANVEKRAQARVQAETKIQAERLAKIKAPTLSKRAELGDEKAKAEVEARTERRNKILQEQLSAKKKEADAKVLVELKEEVARTQAKAAEKAAEQTKRAGEDRWTRAARVLKEIAKDESDAKNAKHNKEPETQEQVQGIIDESGVMEPVEDQKTEIAPSLKELKPSTVVVDQEYVKEVVEQKRDHGIQHAVDEAEKAYVKAYKEYDPKIAKKFDDETIIVIDPPSFSIFHRKQRNELVRLQGVMVEARKKMADEFSLEPKTREALSESARASASKETALTPEVRQELTDSNKLDDLREKLAGREDDKETRKFQKSVGKYEYSQGIIKPERVIKKSDGIRIDLIDAYKKMGVNLTADNTEEVLAKIPPFRYEFSPNGRAVRRLYDQYVKKLEEEK